MDSGNPGSNHDASIEGRPACASSPLRTCQVQKTGYFFFFAAFFFVAFFFAAFFLAAIRDHLLG